VQGEAKETENGRQKEKNRSHRKLSFLYKFFPLKPILAFLSNMRYVTTLLALFILATKTGSCSAWSSPVDLSAADADAGAPQVAMRVTYTLTAVSSGGGESSA